MSGRRRRGYRPGQAAQVGKALRPGAAITPDATFTAAQVLALTQAGLMGASIGPTKPLPRDPNWITVPFGPGNPLFPQGINQAPPGQRQAEPRQFEYPVSWNLPGFTDRLVPWTILRSAADIPLFRQCIELRKQEAVTKAWEIRVSENAVRRAAATRPGESITDIRDALQKKVQPDIGRLTDFWQEPDRWNGRDFMAWCTMLLEETFVLDAVAIYPRRQRNGDLYGFEILDGSTIKPLLDDFGRRPMPPNPAYQQVLYGFPRGEFISDIDLDPEMMPGKGDSGDDTYTADQLIYSVQHVRTFTPYGHSAVERALQDGDLYMRRHGWLRAEYTDGVMPSGWLEAGEAQADWTPPQLEMFEKAFNDYYSGQTQNRQRFRILPWGMHPTPNPDVGERYRTELDLHLLRLVVRHFDTTATELGFIGGGRYGAGMGAATGAHVAGQELQQKTAEAPTLDRLAKLITKLQIRFLKAPPELEFVYPSDEQDEETKADVMWANRVMSGRATRNEDRDRLGLSRFEFPEADMPAIQTGAGLLFIEGSAQSAQPGQPVGAGPLPPINPDGTLGPPPPGGPGGPGGPPGPPGGGGPGPNAGPPVTGTLQGPGGTPPFAPGGPNGVAGGAPGAAPQQPPSPQSIQPAQPNANAQVVAPATYAQVPELVKAELAKFRKWRRNLDTGRVRDGLFTFEHVNRATATAAGIDPTLVLFKAEVAELTKDGGYAAPGGAAPAGGGGGGTGGGGASGGYSAAPSGGSAAPSGGDPNFDPTQHPRGQPQNAGEFVAGGGGANRSAQAAAAGAAQPPTGPPGSATHALGGVQATAHVTVADIAAHDTTSGQAQLKAGQTLGPDGVHASQEMSPAMAAAQQRNQLMMARNNLLAQRFAFEQKRAAEADARRAAAEAKAAAREAAREAKAQAAAAYRAKIQNAINYSNQVNAGNGSSYGDYNNGGAADSGNAQTPQLTPAQVAVLTKVAAGEELTEAEVAELTKVWDPALHPRDYHGRFAPVGVLRPRKPGGWGRSVAEIAAWEDARARGEGTMFQHGWADKGIGRAVPVAHAKVPLNHRVVQAQDLHMQPSDNRVRALLAGRNAEELKQLRAEVGGGVVPKGQRVALADHKNAIVEAVRNAREARQAAAAGRHRAPDADNDGKGAAGWPKIGDTVPRQPGEADGPDHHFGYNAAQDWAVHAARVGNEIPPHNQLDMLRNLTDREHGDLAPHHQEMVADRVRALMKDPDQQIGDRAARIGARFGVFDKPIPQRPAAAPAGGNSLFGERGAAHMAAAAKVAEVSQAHQKLQNAHGDLHQMSAAIRGLNHDQLVDLHGRVGGHGAEGFKDDEKLRRGVLVNALGQEKALGFIKQGVSPNAAAGMARPSAVRAIRDHFEARDRNQAMAVARQADIPLSKRPRGAAAVAAGLPAIPHEMRGAHQFTHADLDRARGDKAGMQEALRGLRKQDIIDVAKERGHQIDGMRAKKDVLLRQFMVEEAFKHRVAEAEAGGMSHIDAVNWAHDRAKQVAEAVAQEQHMAGELRAQRALRREAMQRDPASLVESARRHAQAAIHGEAAGPKSPTPPPVKLFPVGGDAAAIRDHIAARQSEIKDHLAAGVKSERAPDVQGMIAETKIVTHNDGSRTVDKTAQDSQGLLREEQADSEELGAHLALHMGVNAPVVMADKVDEGRVHMQMLEGFKTAAAVTNEGQQRRIAQTPAGRMLGLFDVMTGQTDRHPGNWMIRDGADLTGKNLQPHDIAVIDNGFGLATTNHGHLFGLNDDDMRSLGLRGAGQFYNGIGYYGDWLPHNDYTTAEIDKARQALEAMKPEFNRMGHMSWYNMAMARLGEVASRSKADILVRERILDAGHQ